MLQFYDTTLLFKIQVFDKTNNAKKLLKTVLLIIYKSYLYTNSIFKLQIFKTILYIILLKNFKFLKSIRLL